MNAIANTHTTDLHQLDVADLLQLMIRRHNLEAVELERLGQYNDQLLAEKLEDDERLQQLRHQVKALEARDTVHALEKQALVEQVSRMETAEEDHWADLLRVNEQLQLATRRADQAEAELAELKQRSASHINELAQGKVVLEAELEKAQQELKTLRGDDNPKKLKAQVKRLKDKNAELQARNGQLLRETNQYRQEKSAQQKELSRALGRIGHLEQKADSLSHTRIFSQGDYHLTVWPQVVTMLDTQAGKPVTGRLLLCMHQSGRGGLVVQDPDTGKAMLMPAPKGGLRLPDPVAEVASDWLRRVNTLQGGEVTEADFRLVAAR